MGGVGNRNLIWSNEKQRQLWFLWKIYLEKVIFRDNFAAMARTILFYENHFIKFYQEQDETVKSKIQYVLEIIKQVDRVPDKFLKHITGTDGLYEIRIEYQSNIYRIFCCFDKGNLVILFNGFQKKSQKTPNNELKRAKELMNAYFQQNLNQ